MDFDFLPELPNKVFDEAEARALSPLVLAFVGDGVQTLFFRTKFVRAGDFKAGVLHRLVSHEVNAAAQAKKVLELLSEFTEEEEGVFRRAKNSRVNTSPKNTSMAEYKTAHGFEAVIGYLYLTGQHERLLYLLNK